MTWRRMKDLTTWKMLRRSVLGLCPAAWTQDGWYPPRAYPFTFEECDSTDLL